MGKFKAGQKVKVREELTGGSTYGEIYFADGMEKYRGKEFEIDEVFGSSDNRYRLQGDIVETWIFSEEMLEEIKNPSQVLHIDQATQLEIYVDRIIVNNPATIMFYRTPNYDRATGEFLSWSDQKKVVSKANVDIGDEYDLAKGVDVATLKAFRKEIDKQLRKF